MIRPLAIVVFVSLNASCVFVGLERNGSHLFENPPLSVERAKFACTDLASLETSPSTRRGSAGVTKTQLKAAWGDPDDVEVAGSVERWTYDTGWRWNGVWAFFIAVPVPLVVPTGREALVLEFSGDKLQAAEAHYQVSQAWGCAALPRHGGPCEHGEPDDGYALHSTFCGYGKALDPSRGDDEQAQPASPQ